MKVYLSVDMEGIGGISHSDPTERGDAGYPAAVGADGRRGERRDRGRVRGRRDARSSSTTATAGCSTSSPEDLDPRAVLLQGQKPWSMVAGAGPDRGFDVALFVGYHTRAGHPTGTIAHTYSSAPTLTLLQGRPVGESGINAMVLGAWGIPVGMVAGDDQLALETEAWLPWAEKVIVKSRREPAGGRVSPPERGARPCPRRVPKRAVRRAGAGELQALDARATDHARGRVPQRR